MTTPPLAIPVIPPCEKKFFLSVMIPVYNRITHLAQTLESVLSQVGDKDWIQIMVVDDHSTRHHVERMVREIGQGRIEYYQGETNIGLGGNFNRCVNLARSVWVHILHSDDYVLPGFYSEVLRIASDPEIESIVFRCRQVREDDSIICETPDLSAPNSARHHFLRPMPVQCPGVVIKRSAYERLGGWTTNFKYVLDVETWTRIFFNAKTFYSPKIMAAFRIHKLSETSEQLRIGGEFWELYRLLPVIKNNMNLTLSELRLFHDWIHRRANDHCRIMAKTGDVRNWLKMQRHYFGQIDSPMDVLNFVLRIERNFRFILAAKFAGRQLEKKHRAELKNKLKELLQN